MASTRDLVAERLKLRQCLVVEDDVERATFWSRRSARRVPGIDTDLAEPEVGLVFSGEISLANKGGFASARSAQDTEIGRRATGATALRVHAVADGKTYLVKVGTVAQQWSYIQRFRTEPAVSRT